VKLPNYENAIISETKITGYLLSNKHRGGRSKADFFYNWGLWLTLGRSLRKAYYRMLPRMKLPRSKILRLAGAILLRVNFLDLAVKQLSFTQSGSSKQESISRGL